MLDTVFFILTLSHSINNSKAITFVNSVRGLYKHYKEVDNKKKTAFQMHSPLSSNDRA